MCAAADTVMLVEEYDFYAICDPDPEANYWTAAWKWAENKEPTEPRKDFCAVTRKLYEEMLDDGTSTTHSTHTRQQEKSTSSDGPLGLNKHIKVFTE